MDKQLPFLPRDLRTPTGGRSTTLAPLSTGGRVNMEHPYPTLVLEKFPSMSELALISSWHDATAARQVRFQRKPTPDDYLRSFPSPMSEVEALALSTSRANNDTTRWEPLTREQPVYDPKLEEKEPKKLRSSRSQNILDIGEEGVRPTPNWNSAANPGVQKISRPVRFAPWEATASTTPPTRPTYTFNQLASAPTHSTDLPIDDLDEASEALGTDMNDGGIYLTFHPDCRSSRGEGVLTFLSPIPDEDRSMSDIKFRKRSAMPQDTSTRAGMQPVNGLQSFLNLED